MNVAGIIYFLQVVPYQLSPLYELTSLPLELRHIIQRNTNVRAELNPPMCMSLIIPSGLARSSYAAFSSTFDKLLVRMTLPMSIRVGHSPVQHRGLSGTWARRWKNVPGNEVRPWTSTTIPRSMISMLELHQTAVMRLMGQLLQRVLLSRRTHIDSCLRRRCQ